MTTKTPEQTTHWLAPFSVRSFKFQWPSDLATSWAFEMETLILGWYILVESGSVMLLVVFGALNSLERWYHRSLAWWVIALDIAECYG